MAEFITDYKDLNNQSNYIDNVILLGNKCDLVDGREVGDDLIMQYLESEPSMQYYETSAMLSTGVDESLMHGMYNAIRLLIDQTQDEDVIRDKSFNIGQQRNTIESNRLSSVHLRSSGSMSTIGR